MQMPDTEEESKKYTNCFRQKVTTKLTFSLLTLSPVINLNSITWYLLLIHLFKKITQGLGRGDAER